MRRFFFPTFIVAMALAGCSKADPAPTDSDSIAGSLQGLKSGPAESHSGPPKTEKAPEKPAGT